MMAAIVPPTAGDAESVSLQWDALKVPECVLARDGHACVGVPDGGSLVFGGTVVQVLASGQSGKAVETAEVVYIQPLTSPAEDGTLGVNVNVSVHSCAVWLPPVCLPTFQGLSCLAFTCFQSRTVLYIYMYSGLVL